MRLSRGSDRGMVTAETAVVLPVLVVVLVLALHVVALGAAQLRCIDAARVAVRAVARGEAVADAVQAAAAAAPRDAVVEVAVDDGTATVWVRARLAAPAALGLVLPGFSVRAHASAAVEATGGE